MNDVLLAAQPTKRFVTPEEVAALAVYLCREEARVDHRRESQHRRRMDRGLSVARCNAHRLILPCRVAPRLLPAATCSCSRRGMIARWTTAWQASRDRERPCAAARLARDILAALAAAARPATRPRSRAKARCSIPMRRSAARPIPDGMYRCRVIKLGAKAPGNLDFRLLPRVHLPRAAERKPAAARQAQRIATIRRPDLPRRCGAPGVPRHAGARR